MHILYPNCECWLVCVVILSCTIWLFTKLESQPSANFFFLRPFLLYRLLDNASLSKFGKSLKGFNSTKLSETRFIRDSSNRRRSTDKSKKTEFYWKLVFSIYQSVDSVDRHPKLSLRPLKTRKPFNLKIVIVAHKTSDYNGIRLRFPSSFFGIKIFSRLNLMFTWL